MDKNLKDVFTEQKEFQKYFYDPDNTDIDEKIKFTKEYILSIHRELGEVLNTLPWKLHRKEDKEISIQNLNEEIIDCFKFLLNLCIIWNIDHEKFVNEFFRKSMVVRQRYNQEILNTIKETDKVCAIDLDDTLAESDHHFTVIYNEKNGTFFNCREDIKNTLNTLEYEEFKTWYRESGEKINIDTKVGAKEITEYLKNKGYRIVIISARPYEKHNRIFPDTMQWLTKNGIKYDALYFEKDKHITILKKFPNLDFIIEDNIEYANEIAKQGYHVFLLNDRNISENLNITNIKSLSHIANYK